MVTLDRSTLSRLEAVIMARVGVVFPFFISNPKKYLASNRSRIEVLLLPDFQPER